MSTGSIMAFPFKDPEFGLQAGMTLLDYYATHAPIDFETAVRAWGSTSINLIDDKDRDSFMAMWAYLRYEYAEAMLEEKLMRMRETDE